MLRVEANKAAAAYRDKQGAVEQQILQIDRLNSVISRLEREMLALKRQYETAVESRNYTGIQLIDRNDELCILYEKSNVHERTLSEGEAALRAIADEMRGMHITVSELERQLHVRLPAHLPPSLHAPLVMLCAQCVFRLAHPRHSPVFFSLLSFRHLLVHVSYRTCSLRATSFRRRHCGRSAFWSCKRRS